MPRHLALILAAAALCACPVAVTAAPLPFADGTYVTRPELCRMTDRQRADRYGYDVIEMVRHIEGARLTDGYALNCRVVSARTDGNTIRYRASCNVEGTRETSNGTFTRIDERTFRSGRITYRACGGIRR